MTDDGPSLKQPPTWVRDAVFYQIFPDRFAKSPRLTKPSNVLSWKSPPMAQAYHGGDLLGIVEHLDHLVDLGINALYLTPIFQSASNHRYHTHDYWTVDPLLGGNEALRELVRSAHDRGIRIVLDGVFNHASRGFFPFHDVLENGRHSPWLDWFHIHDWPLSPYDGRRPANYEGWAGNRALPKLNTDNPQVREFLMQVGEYWIREFDIDGWRLDVPTEIRTPGFWEEFRQRVRAVKSDAYLVGEIWGAAPEWLEGNRFDATMNYEFAAAAIAFAAGPRVSQQLVEDRAYDVFPGIDAEQLGKRIQQLLALYRWETTLAQLNLLGSHDAPRVVSIARGDRDTLRLATLLQMTFPGAPCVYYGDEIALQGTKRYDRPHRDQDARWPFPWHDQAKWDEDMLQFFRAVIKLRHQCPVLRQGEFTQLSSQEHCFAFLRHAADQRLLIVLNAADQDVNYLPQFEDLIPAGLSPRILSGAARCDRTETGGITVTVPARSGAVLQI
jgi:cyclomaltodextrinase